MLLLAGCGKPQPGGGPPPDMAVLAVVAKVKPQSAQDRVSAVGEIAAAEQVHLVSEVDATLMEVLVNDGDPVKRGQILYRFDAGKLVALAAQAEARLSLAKSELERTRSLRASNTIPQQDVDRAQAEFLAAEAAALLARDNLEDAVVTAPLDGVLEDRPVSLGQFCTRGQHLGRLVQVDPVDLLFAVPERDAGRLAVGQSVRLRLEGGEPREGTIHYLAPELSGSTRALRVKARLANPDGQLRPGRFGTVEIEVARRENVIRIPESAVLLHGEKAQVVVMNAEGRAEFRPVTTGARGDAEVEVTGGLAADEIVVVEGHQKLGPGVRIQVSPKSSAYGVTPPAPSGAADAPSPGQRLPSEPAADGK
jgi:membrane fusion protein (multidrug efflux system)